MYEYTPRIRNVTGVWALRIRSVAKVKKSYTTILVVCVCRTTHSVAKGLNWNLMCSENVKIIVLKYVQCPKRAAKVNNLRETNPTNFK